jgi:hypothetical protein
MSNADITAPKQRGTPFPPGVSGNPAGRPRGSRGKLSEDFLADLHAAWSAHGATALERCALEEPGTFVKVIANLLPRNVDINLTAAVVDVASFREKFRNAVSLLGNEPPRLRKPLRTIEHEANNGDNRG